MNGGALMGQSEAPVRHFLVTKRFGKLESVEVYDDAAEAVRKYEQRERECGWITAVKDETPAPAECVLLGADRLATLLVTHGNWFDEPSGLEDHLLEGWVRRPPIDNNLFPEDR